jgi:hypothetical protein
VTALAPGLTRPRERLELGTGQADGLAGSDDLAPRRVVDRDPPGETLRLRDPFRVARCEHRRRRVGRAGREHVLAERVVLGV